MTQSVNSRLFGLAALVALLLAAFAFARSAQAGFVQNESNYWNAGNLTLPSNGNGNLEHCTLESSNLKTPHNTVGFNVYTPPSYGSGSQSYPVIYLLHGLNGNEFNYFGGFSNSTFFNSGSGSLPSRIDNGQAPEAIVVVVNGGARSFYDDWDDSTGSGPSSSFPILSESVIMEDVIPFVDANFRTIASRNGRAIEGFSMGGRGAIKLAFSYPDMFCSTIAYAAAAFEEIPPVANTPTNPHPRLGPLPAEYRISTITANNAAAILSSGLQIRLVDGAGDGAAGQGGGSPALSSQLTSLGIPHQFEPSLAGVTSHNWSPYHQANGAADLNFHFQCLSAATYIMPAPIILGSTADLFTFLPMIVNPASPPPTPTPTPTPLPTPPPVSPGTCS